MHPVTRTFLPRRRRLSPTRQRVLDAHGPKWMLAAEGGVLDRAGLTDVFGREAPVVLEIGIGLGEALLGMAVADPATDVLGVDVHTPGIARVVATIEDDGLANIRLVHGDALVFLDRIAPGTLAGVRAFFPDPWPKPRQRVRRLVTAPNVERLVERLAPGGFVHLATDIADYAEQMHDVCTAHPRLSGGVAPRPAARPLTKYERKGLDAGRPITDLLFTRGDR